jgi:hypothetical protein
MFRCTDAIIKCCTNHFRHNRIIYINIWLFYLPNEGLDTAVGIRHADHVAPSYLQKLTLTSPISGGCSVGIVRWRTQATEFFYNIIAKYKYGLILIHNYCVQGSQMYFWLCKDVVSILESIFSNARNFDKLLSGGKGVKIRSRALILCIIQQF